MLLPPRLAWAIISVVTLVWGANFGLQFVVPNYHPDAAIDGIFLAVVGGAIALSHKGRARDDRDDDDEGGDDDDGDGPVDPLRSLRDLRAGLDRDPPPPRRHRAAPSSRRDRDPPPRRPRYRDDDRDDYPGDQATRYPERDYR